MTPSYDYEALWMKAKLFLNRAMDASDERTFEEQALWASLALELLGKAALSRISPLLIATPTEEGSNLLVASGLVAGEATFQSITARTLYKRCSRAFKPFSEKEASQVTRSRNEYLHGGGVGFVEIPMEAWWPNYWAQASILVNALDRQIEDLVGADRVPVVEGHLAQRRRNIEERVEMLIERARQRLEQHRSGTLPTRVAEEWMRTPDLRLGLRHSTGHECPACQSIGFLEGDNVAAAEPHYEQVGEDDFDVWIDLTVDADYFSCDTCHLVLDRYELIVEAGLPESFADTGDAEDFFEPDYGND